LNSKTATLVNRQADTGTTRSTRLQAALKLPNGARFYRCARQVNPFAYPARQRKQTNFRSEEEYNAAIVAACQQAEIEVIGVTGHYRVQESLGLLKAARLAGLYAFSGFEAITKDGVHFLCLFDPDKDSFLERFIGECGIRDRKDLSPIGEKDCLELLDCAKKWGGICIAAHVAADQGGLRKLSVKPRINVWTASGLLACALPGPISDAPEALRPILENRDGEYHRSRPVAVINASDINDPDDLKKDGASCFIKMSSISVEALRQSFLDPQSRIRLNSDPRPQPHAELLALAWEGGFLGDTSVHLNET